MLRSTPTRWALAAVAASALCVSLSGAPSHAHDGNDDHGGACRTECSEARRICRGAAHAAWRACGDDCAEAVREAVRHAREACKAGDLSTGECFRLIREASRDALGACRDDCKNEREIARTLCRDERSECREACVAGLDPACVEGCHGAFETCRGELETCTAGCRSAFESARDACATSAVVDGACDAEAYRECVAAAHDEAAACAAACHEAQPCASELRECLGECPAVEHPGDDD